MSGERWFPLKHVLPNRMELGRLLQGGPDWQIFDASRDGRVLVAQVSLANRWVSSGLLPNTIFDHFSFSAEPYCFLYSGESRQLEAVNECASVDSKADALAFAISLRETRKIDNETPLHDAIYLERFSRLLPTWSVSEAATDEEVLGRWLTGGVSVSATSFRRMSSLMSWLGKDDLIDLVEAAEIDLSGRVADEIEGRSAKGRRELPDNRPSPKALTGQSDDFDSASAKAGFRLAGRSVLEAFFNEHVIDIIENADRYKSFGVEFPTAMVLHGPPGCGKTFAVEKLGEYLDWPIFHIDSNSVGSPYIHETSRKVGEIFDKSIDAAPAMVVIDEMESYLSDRQLHGSTGIHHVEEVAEFLRRIPEACRNHVLVVGMTNRLEMIDSAILRRGRFDHVIEVGMPSAEEVSELLSSLLGKMPSRVGLEIQDVVKALTGRALSDAAFVVREAARLAAKSGKHELDEGALVAGLALLPSPGPEKNPIGFMRG